MHFRAHARRHANLHCTVRRGSAAHAQAPAIVRNLGLGGALIESELRLEVGDVVELSLPVATRWEPLSLNASVVWTDHRRAGISFAPHLSERAHIELLPLLLDALSAARTNP